MSDIISAIIGGVPLQEKMEMERLIYHLGSEEMDDAQRKELSSAFAYIAAHEGISLREMLEAIMYVKAKQKPAIVERETSAMRRAGVIK